MRVFRLSAAGARVVDDAIAARAIDESGAPQQLLDRLVDTGALHPVPTTGPFTPGDVTIVVPAHNRLPTWRDARMIIVDDGSLPPLPDVHARHDHNRGPGAARNTGLALVTTPLVAFVDTDVSITPEWLSPLLAHFADDRVALVAPRVASAPGGHWLAAYERRNSPLDLGIEPGRVAAGTRVSYVPSTALVCRTAAVRAVGGFDEQLRTGEDVDLVWRLVLAGHRCRYEPSAVVHHHPRRTLADLLRQRYSFGRAAAPLAARHRGAVAPVRMNAWSAMVWLLTVMRRPLPAAAVLAGATAALIRKLPSVPAAESVRLATLGTAAAGRQLADAAVRVWWPIAVVVALTVRRSRLPLAAAVLAPAVTTAVRRRTAAPLIDAPVQLLDRMAYGAGVWAGSIAARDWAALVPQISPHSAHTDAGTTPQRIS